MPILVRRPGKPDVIITRSASPQDIPPSIKFGFAAGGADITYNRAKFLLGIGEDFAEYT